MEDMLSLSWAGKMENWYIRLPRLDREIANLYGRFAEYLKKTRKGFMCLNVSFSPSLLPASYSKSLGFMTPANSSSTHWLKGCVLTFCFGYIPFCFDADLGKSPLPSAPERHRSPPDTLFLCSFSTISMVYLFTCYPLSWSALAAIVSTINQKA